MDAQEKSTDGVIEVVPSQPITPDGQDNAPAAGIPAADAPPGSSSPGSVPTQDTPLAEPYVHRMPDFLADRQRTPPKLSGMPKSISIKEAMGGKRPIKYTNNNGRNSFVRVCGHCRYMVVTVIPFSIGAVAVATVHHTMLSAYMASLQ